MERCLRFVRIPAITLAILTVSGCDGRSTPGVVDAPDLSLTDIFSLTASFDLEEEEVYPIGGLRSFYETMSGDLLIGDQYLPRVRRYDDNGGLIAAWGRFGDGPFEFRRVSDVAEDDTGAVLVIDSYALRITVLTRNLEPDRFLPLSRPPFTIQPVGGGVAVGLLVTSSATPVFEWVDGAGAFGWSAYHKPNEIYARPYWSSFAGTVVSSSDRELYIGVSLFYPIEAFGADGTTVDSFGHPPPSFSKITPVEPGAFTGGLMSPGIGEWLANFTVIDGLYVLQDSLLVVPHARKKSSGNIFPTNEQYAFDVYDLADRMKIAEDVELPPDMRIVGAGQSLYTLDESSPGIFRIGRWTPLPRSGW